MTKTEFKELNLQSQYELYNIILFNNSLPNSSKIDFILHNLPYAAGYSKYRTKPSRTGNIHEIAFCKYFKFTEKQITEILIHEMIHLWQVTHVAEWRYKICSNDIAHDKVFISKMNTINLILKNRGFDFEIKEVFDEKLELDENVKPRNSYYIFYAETFSGEHKWTKVQLKDLDSVLAKFKDESLHQNYFRNVYYKKERSYRHNLLEYSNGEYFYDSVDMNNNTDCYNSSDPMNIWVIKDGKNII